MGLMKVTLDLRLGCAGGTTGGSGGGSTLSSCQGGEGCEDDSVLHFEVCEKV